ncbi:MAG: SPASM domain-containing protein [Candidatus Zixiibacteriota bacterium]|nr:MAG: SPASM domain-containing protein [candidate division Zixibacteria bacterium]
MLERNGDCIEGMMKSSRYNLFLDIEEGKKLAFNGVSAALAEIEADKFPIIQKILDDPSSAETAEEKSLFSALRHGKYLIDGDTDELTALKVRSRRQRFSKNAYLLTIAPTLACNLKCDYCFVSQQAVRMSQETEKALLRFKESDLRRSDSLAITWFGGEPTLCPDTIERLQDGYHELCSRYRVELHPSGIVTNGYLLDAAMASRLQQAGVVNAQITLDGPREVHDARRKQHNGKGTFDRIIDNIGTSVDKLRISVRVNVDRDNINSTLELMDYLDSRKILRSVAVNFAQVLVSQGVCSDMRENCFSEEEYAKEQLRLYRTLIDHGYDQISYPNPAGGGACAAGADNGWVVSPSGDLFKCWEEISADQSSSVGSVFDLKQDPRQKANLDRYLGWDPFEKPGCVKCDILPLCMGGCPQQALKIDSKEEGACCSWKYNLKEMLILRYLCDQLQARKRTDSGSRLP